MQRKFPGLMGVGMGLLLRRAMHLRRARPLCALASLALWLSGAALRAQAPDRAAVPVDLARVQPLAFHHPRWASSANDLGPAPADLELSQLTLVMARSPQRQQAFEQFLAEQQNPLSPQFHQWLTPAEVGERFGPSKQEVEAVRGWLESQGLSVDWVASSGQFIGFSGTVEAVSRAFQTGIHNYKVNGAERLSVASDPIIPQALAPAILAVRGLYSIADRPAHLARAQDSAVPEMTNGGSDYLTPQDFAAIYDLPSNLGGSGVTIGIVGWARVNTADLNAFRQKTGTTFADPTQIVPTAFGGVDPGAAYTTPQNCTNNCLSGQEEATLDVQRAGGVAPDANLLLVVSSSSGANDGIGADAQYLIQTTPVPAQVIDISFGDCESDAGPSGVSYWNNLFQQAAAEGISVFVSSGDSGAAGCDDSFAAPPSSPAAISPNYICSSPYATCVGGTEFNDTADPAAYWSATNSSALGSALGYIPEGGWNEPLSAALQPQAAASGGGASRYVATPAWQMEAAGAPAAHAGRYTPDVAFASSCREGYFGCLAAGGGSCVAGSSGTYYFEVFCGTSAAAPSMAGVAALLDEQMGGAAQGNLNPALYPMQASSPAAFHDVTVASSGVSNCSLSTPSICNNSVPAASSLSVAQAGYMVGPGYDEVTGLGSLDVQTFLDRYGATGSSSSVVTPSAAAGFAISGSPITISSGSAGKNTSTITVQPSAGFTGAVTLTAQIVSSPAGAQNLPALSFGSTSPVTIVGANPATATLTILTAMQATGEARLPAGRWAVAGSTALACLLLFWVPGLPRGWRNLLGMIALLAALGCGAAACGSGGAAAAVAASQETTKGSYVISVTGTSGSAASTGIVALTVQ